MNRNKLRWARFTGLLLFIAVGNTACTHQRLGACLSYEPQESVSTVSMRGFGYVRVVQETMVCTKRSEVLVASAS
ncbi:MAG: hypothetical protein AAGG55_16800 [Pseudomonadota bacterium]